MAHMFPNPNEVSNQSNSPTPGFASHPPHTAPYAKSNLSYPQNTPAPNETINLDDSDDEDDLDKDSRQFREANGPELFLKKRTWTTYLDKQRAVAGPDSQPGKKGRSRASKGINVNHGFIVDRNGQAIDGHDAGEIHTYFRPIWQAWLDEGTAPLEWQHLSINLAISFWQTMEARFPLLAICENGWKSS